MRFANLLVNQPCFNWIVGRDAERGKDNPWTDARTLAFFERLSNRWRGGRTSAPHIPKHVLRLFCHIFSPKLCILQSSGLKHTCLLRWPTPKRQESSCRHDLDLVKPFYHTNIMVQKSHSDPMWELLARFLVGWCRWGRRDFPIFSFLFAFFFVFGTFFGCVK